MFLLVWLLVHRVVSAQEASFVIEGYCENAAPYRMVAVSCNRFIMVFGIRFQFEVTVRESPLKSSRGDVVGNKPKVRQSSCTRVHGRRV